MFFSMPSFVDFTASDVGTDLEFNILGEPTTTKTITINTNERTITIVAPTNTEATISVLNLKAEPNEEDL